MAEILAMLNAKTVDYNSSGHSTGETLRPEDVAAALSGICNQPMLTYTYVKFCGQNDLYARLLPMQQQSQRYKFKIKGYNRPDYQINALAEIALNTALIPQHCTHCNGTGNTPKKGGWETCASCKGTGLRKDISDKRLGKIIGSDRKNLVKTFWRYRLNEQIAEYQEWDVMVTSYIKKRLTTAYEDYH